MRALPAGGPAGRSRPRGLNTLDDALGAVDLLDDAARLAAGDLEPRVAAVAGGLRAAGVARGDAVAWQKPNCIDAVVLYRACWRIGAVAVPIHHLAGTTDRSRVLDAVRPALVVGEGLPEGPPVAAGAGAGGAGGAAGDDRAVVLFTSGSAGRPKGVVHTQGRLAYKAELMVRVHGLTAADSVLMPAPLAHVSGLLNAVLVPGAAGMKTVLMAKWDPDRALEIIESERITFMIGPPTFFVGLMGAESFAPDRVESLRLVSSGGAGVTPSFVSSAAAALGAIVKRTYGSTEAPTITTAHAGDDPARGRDTDGRPTGSVALRVDPVTGELQVQGPELFVGYLDPSDDVGAFTDDGWFRTGDIGVIDDDGWLTIVGRLKDVIIRGGENIAPAEIEAALEAHPAVRHAVAVGQPDDRLGERVVAFVVLEPATTFDVDECREWFAARGIARFKTPERVVVLDEMPVLAAGKPDRAALRARL